MTIESLGILTEDDLTDMFSSFAAPFRQEVLCALDKSIDATLKDAKDPEADICIRDSLQRLTVMRKCCRRAHIEFEELNRKEPNEDLRSA